MGFELSYAGPITKDSYEGVDAREQLHKKICDLAYPTPSRRGQTSDGGLAGRQGLSNFRVELEKKFSARISGEIGSAFSLDTILLDVPEPRKDQIKGVYVDRHSKRSRRVRLGEETGSEFLDLASTSPIAATLSDVFMRWARKVRIFMTDDDLHTLKGAGFEVGDVAYAWEQTLIDYFSIDRKQPVFRGLC
jgi:hypothetical protein